jgi:hypothetical protein
VTCHRQTKASSFETGNQSPAGLIIRTKSANLFSDWARRTERLPLSVSGLSFKSHCIWVEGRRWVVHDYYAISSQSAMLKRPECLNLNAVLRSSVVHDYYAISSQSAMLKRPECLNLNAVLRSSVVHDYLLCHIESIRYAQKTRMPESQCCSPLIRCAWMMMMLVLELQCHI